MKASKIISALFIVGVLCLFVPQTGFCQTESLDGVTYTPPAGWTKTPKEGAAVYVVNNKSTNAFCILTIYGSSASAGSASRDFADGWNNLAVGPFNAPPSPKTETQTNPEGWQSTTGGAEIEISKGVKALAILTVFSGFGKTISVLAIFNDQSYLSQIQAFIDGIKPDKTAAPAAKPPAAQNNQTTVQDNRPGKFGAITYAVPRGWSEQQFSDGVVFKPSDLPAGETLAIQIMPPLNATGALEQALAQSYDEAAAMYKMTKMNETSGGNYIKTEAKKSFNGWEYIRGKGGVQLENGTPYKTELGLEVFVIKVNNRFERVAILESRKNCNLSRYLASDRRSFRSGIENFLFSLQFTDFNEPALKTGSANGAGIVGVWRGISLSVGAASIDAQLGVRSKVFSPIFLTNGQAYFGPGFLVEGLDGVNTRLPAELNRRNWGTYTFSNGRGVLKMPYGDIPLRMEGNNLIITSNQTDHSFLKINPVDGAVFNGTYSLSGSEGKIVSITFTSDGRFTDNGAIRVLNHEYIDCIDEANAPGSGTYEVKDYSIIFNYSDGRKIKIAFLGIDYDKNNPAPASLIMSFNEDKLVRK